MDAAKMELGIVKMPKGDVTLREPDVFITLGLLEAWQDAAQRKKLARLPILKFATLGVCWPDEGMAWGTLDDYDDDLVKYGRRVGEILRMSSPEPVGVLAARGDRAATILFARLYPSKQAEKIVGNSEGAASSPSSSASEDSASATPSRTSA